MSPSSASPPVEQGETPSEPGTVPVEERLFSLVLALVSTEIGLTKNQILATVQGYRQKYRTGEDNTSLERQFERDKDDIRELGVPLETIEPLSESGNSQGARYRIPKGEYDLPLDLSFSAEETTLLNLAALVWREGSLSSESRRALLKLRSLGSEATEPLLGYAPRVRTREPSFGPLTDALARSVLVRFSYLKPGDTTARLRTVAPLAVVQHQSRWYLQATDQDAGRTRTFLLSRISGAVTVTRTPCAKPDPRAGEQALAELDEIWQSHVATVQTIPGTDAASRLGTRRGSMKVGGDRLSLHYTDLALLSDELASFGPEVVVLSPPELASAVHTRLVEVATDHAEQSAAEKR